MVLTRMEARLESVETSLSDLRRQDEERTQDSEQQIAEVRQICVTLSEISSQEDPCNKEQFGEGKRKKHIREQFREREEEETVGS